MKYKVARTAWFLPWPASDWSESGAELNSWWSQNRTGCWTGVAVAAADVAAAEAAEIEAAIGGRGDHSQPHLEQAGSHLGRHPLDCRGKSWLWIVLSFFCSQHLSVRPILLTQWSGSKASNLESSGSRPKKTLTDSLLFQWDKSNAQACSEWCWFGLRWSWRTLTSYCIVPRRWSVPEKPVPGYGSVVVERSFGVCGFFHSFSISSAADDDAVHFEDIDHSHTMSRTAPETKCQSLKWLKCECFLCGSIVVS